MPIFPTRAVYAVACLPTDSTRTGGLGLVMTSPLDFERNR